MIVDSFSISRWVTGRKTKVSILGPVPFDILINDEETVYCTFIKFASLIFCIPEKFNSLVYKVTELLYNLKYLAQSV